MRYEATETSQDGIGHMMRGDSDSDSDSEI